MKKNWEIKDRTYILAGNRSPLTWTIQTRHTARKPLLWFDEEKGLNREIRYATNQNSLFVDEQDGLSTLAHVMFSDGSLYVPRQKQQLQKLLSLFHPEAGKLWVEVDTAKEAVDEVATIEEELEALNLVQQLEIDELEAIMRSELGSSVKKLSSKELKRDAYAFAKKRPSLFVELSQDEDLKLRNLANRAVESGLLKLTDDNTVFKLPNGKKVLTVPFDQQPYGALSQYFKTDDGIALMKSLTKKLS